MIDAFIIIILVMLGCIGLGVLLGWSFWGSDAKYYKNLAEAYKEKLASPEVKEAILEKRAKEETNRSINYDYLSNHYFYCPVCGCKQYADWITNNEKEDKV